MRLFALALVLVAGAALAEESTANKEQARVHFKQGARLIRSGDPDGALAQFLEAYRLFPNERLHYDIAQAYRLKGDRRAAIEHYRKYLAAVTTGETARDAQAQLQQLLAEQGVEPDIGEADPKLARAVTSREPPPKIDESLKATEPLKSTEAPKQEQEVKTILIVPPPPGTPGVILIGQPPERPRSRRPWLWAAAGGVALAVLAVGLGVGLGTGTHYPSPSIGRITIPGK
jgi:tetratricopeptide (TPR) repeat protein